MTVPHVINRSAAMAEVMPIPNLHKQLGTVLNSGIPLHHILDVYDASNYNHTQTESRHIR